MTLSVSDVERLAKAGVVINFNDVKHDLVSDMPEMTLGATPAPPQSLLETAFWDRYRRNARATRPNDYHTEFHIQPFSFSAHETEDVVHCCLCDGKDFVVIEDQKALYPSDALLAAIHLWGKSK